jgi:hypothetical protein
VINLAHDFQPQAAEGGTRSWNAQVLMPQKRLGLIAALTSETMSHNDHGVPIKCRPDDHVNGKVRQ